jgi:hypothetical protein
VSDRIHQPFYEVGDIVKLVKPISGFVTAAGSVGIVTRSWYSSESKHAIALLSVEFEDGTEISHIGDDIAPRHFTLI